MWGLIIAVCGCAVVWGGNSGAPDSVDLLDKLSSVVEDVDAAAPLAENDGKAVRVVAPIGSSEMLGDEFLESRPWLVLVREVEMFQWAEKAVPADTTNGGDGYVLDWAAGQIDFFQFRVPEGHENPALLHQPFSRTVESVHLGGYNAKELLDYLVKGGREKFLSELTLTPELLKDKNLEVRGNWLIVRRNPGMIGDNLGDMRFRYHVFEPTELTVIARQTETNKLSTGLIDGNPYFLAEKGDVSLSEILRIDEQESSKTKVTILGGLLVFFGLLSLIIPFSANLDLRPTADLTGKAAAVAVSAVISVVAVLLLVVGTWIRG